MSAADRLAALREDAADADDWHIQLACLREFQSAAPALEALVRAAEEYVGYWTAREATWATWGACEDGGHEGHTEPTCPAWEAVSASSLTEGDHEPIAAALAELGKVLP